MMCILLLRGNVSHPNTRARTSGGNLLHRPAHLLDVLTQQYTLQPRVPHTLYHYSPPFLAPTAAFPLT